jgi:type I restriction enzyme S subunit
MNSDNQPSSTWGGGKVTEYPVGKLQELALLNHLSMKKTEFNHIYYTDISSVGVGFADRPKYVDSHSAPSRAKRILRKGDTVISTVRPNRRSFFYFDGSWEPAVASTGFVVVSPKDEIDGDFLYAVLTSLEATTFYESICEGGAYPAFNGGNLNEMLIPIPDTIVRRSLGSIVATIDDKIRLNTEMSKTLEAIAQTIFKSWFIDFDPVHAKMRGEKPEGMDDATAALFPDSFEESELGMIPKGWRVDGIGEIFTLQGGFSFKSSSWVERGVPVVKIGSVKPGMVDLHSVSFISEESATSVSTAYSLPKGSLVVGLTGYVGEVGLVPYSLKTPLLNQRVAKFGKRQGEWKIPYCYCLTRREEFKNEVIGLANGSAQQNVSNSQILSIRRALPPLQVMSAFDLLLEPMLENILLLNEGSEILRQVRDSLLPRLISGELEIPDEMLAS